MTPERAAAISKLRSHFGKFFDVFEQMDADLEAAKTTIVKQDKEIDAMVERAKIDAARIERMELIIGHLYHRLGDFQGRLALAAPLIAEAAAATKQEEPSRRRSPLTAEEADRIIAELEKTLGLDPLVTPPSQ